MNSKNIKRIVTATIILVLIVVGIANIRFKSLDDYEKEQQSLRDEILVTKESATQAATQIIVQSTAADTTMPATEPVIEPVTEYATEQVTEPTVNPTINPTTEPTIESTTSTTVAKETINCSISIDCSVYKPDNGTILALTTIKLPKNSTAYDALNQACKAFDIQMEAKFTPIYNTYYVEGINYLYEKAAGNMSGWIYKVNGKVASIGASAYKIKEGDKITWHYTVDGGKDVS